MMRLTKMTRIVLITKQKSLFLHILVAIFASLLCFIIDESGTSTSSGVSRQVVKRRIKLIVTSGPTMMRLTKMTRWTLIRTMLESHRLALFRAIDSLLASRRSLFVGFIGIAPALDSNVLDLAFVAAVLNLYVRILIIFVVALALDVHVLPCPLCSAIGSNCIRHSSRFLGV
jgi:hypothetical protein